MSKPTKIHELDLDRLQEVLDYDAEAGLLKWRVRTSPRAAPGAVAGTIKADGYRHIGIDGKSYMAHQLVWFHVKGEPPEDELDFINGDGSDTRIENLRPASRAENTWNARRPKNTTGYRGVYKFHNRYNAKIRHQGKKIFLGTFATAEEAYEAYCKKAKELHGKFARLK